MNTVNLPRHLLRQVSKPARYVGGEWNSVCKKLPDSPDGDVRPFVRFAFCFPDIYEIGMSNLALRILYDRLNKRNDIWCERVFYPAIDMVDKMRELELPLFALESKSPINDFDLVGFTLQYEMCYTTVLDMLDLGNIPQLTSERGENDPFVIAGGPVVYNIEPMADFFDIVLIGEGEELLPELIDCYQDWKLSGADRNEFLYKAAAIEGVYVPSLYNVSYKHDGTIEAVFPVDEAVPQRVLKRIELDLDKTDFPVDSIVPNMEIIHDRIFLELFRGCTRGCRFCQAGMIYRPVRERSADKLLEQAIEMEAKTGYDEIGMLSLSTSDYSQLGCLTDSLLEVMTPNHTSLSLPSLRLDSFNLGLMEKASRTRKGGLTFAPEAGSQRLRDVINKNIAEEDLLSAMKLAFAGGWSGAKLYFMLGLPTETLEDVAGIAELTAKIEQIHRELPREQRPRRLELTVSTAFFIPKPFTPFQWVPQMSQEKLHEHQRHLRSLIRSRNVKYQWHEFGTSWIEAVLARGDRRLGQVLRLVWSRGARLEAWDEHFDLERWLTAIEDCGLSIDFYTSRERKYEEILPWDHIDCGVNKEFLWQEYQRAQSGETTPACHEACMTCGASCFGGGICYEQK
jgi:radical SAM family uncharacterized protein